MTGITSENPGAGTSSASNDWQAFTFLVKAAAGATKYTDNLTTSLTASAILTDAQGFVDSLLSSGVLTTSSANAQHYLETVAATVLASTVLTDLLNAAPGGGALLAYFASLIGE